MAKLQQALTSSGPNFDEDKGQELHLAPRLDHCGDGEDSGHCESLPTCIYEKFELLSKIKMEDCMNRNKKEILFYKKNGKASVIN